MRHLRIVLQSLKDNKFFAMFRKCEFWLSSISFHGHIVYSEEIEVDQRKT